MKIKSLFFDQLLAEPRVPQEVKENLKKCVVIEATNVSDYYFQGSDQEYWDIGVDYPNVAPPFADFFLEFKAPAQITSKVNGVTQWDKKHMPTMWGLHCMGSLINDLMQDKDAMYQNTLEQFIKLQKVVQTFIHLTGTETQEQFESIRNSISKDERKIVMQYLAMGHALQLMREDKWEPVYEISKQFNAKWNLQIILFWKTPQQQCSGPLWYWSVPVDELGQTIKRPDGETHFSYSAVGETAKRIQEEVGRGNISVAEAYELYSNIYAAMLHTTLLAISFMHCKNVTLNERIPPTIQPTAKQKRWGVKPRQLVTYHVLDIEPMKQVLKTEGQCDKVGLQKSLHICRGHFANYTEKGLFGKYRGTFWIPQHVRGSQQAGVAVKDYRIKGVKDKPQTNVRKP